MVDALVLDVRSLFMLQSVLITASLTQMDLGDNSEGNVTILHSRMFVTQIDRGQANRHHLFLFGGDASHWAFSTLYGTS